MIPSWVPLAQSFKRGRGLPPTPAADWHPDGVLLEGRNRPYLPLTPVRRATPLKLTVKTNHPTPNIGGDQFFCGMGLLELRATLCNSQSIGRCFNESQPRLFSHTSRGLWAWRGSPCWYLKQATQTQKAEVCVRRVHRCGGRLHLHVHNTRVPTGVEGEEVHA